MSTVYATLEVTPNAGGEKYTVDIDMPTAFMWESAYPGRSLGDLLVRPRFSAHDLYELSYVASRRSGHTVPNTLMEFVDANTVRAVPVVEPETDDAGDPTNEGPSTTT